MKKLIPIAILILVLTTGCLRKPEKYESMRNNNVESESVEESSADSKKDEEGKSADNSNENSAGSSENSTTDKKPESENHDKTMKVTADVLNMRKEANKNSNVVTKLKKGDAVKVVEETTDSNGTNWVKIDFNGEIGFVAKEFLGE